MPPCQSRMCTRTGMLMAAGFESTAFSPCLHAFHVQPPAVRQLAAMSTRNVHFGAACSHIAGGDGATLRSSEFPKPISPLSS